MALLDVQCLEKIYTTRFGGNRVQALSNVSFSVNEGEYVAIMGESGSGKTTLLNILAALDKPTKGEVFLDNQKMSEIKDKELYAFRRDNLGFVFQDFNLLDTFSIKDNIFLPLVLSGDNYKIMEKKLQPVADKLGITDILNNFPYEVSGGQKQRTAVARALITSPRLILADEPTAALDYATGIEVLSVIEDVVRSGKSVLMVTHNEEITKMANRVIRMRGGLIDEVIVNRHPKKATDLVW